MIYNLTVNTTVVFDQNQALDTELGNAISTVGFDSSALIGGSQTSLVESSITFESDAAPAINPTDGVSTGLRFNHHVGFQHIRQNRPYVDCKTFDSGFGIISFSLVGNESTNIQIRLKNKDTSLDVETGAVVNYTSNKVPDFVIFDSTFISFRYNVTELSQEEVSAIVAFFETNIGLKLRHVSLDGVEYLGYITNYPLVVVESDDEIFEVTLEFFGELV